MQQIGQLDFITRTVTLQGFTPIMFDRYSGSNDVQLPVEKKMYFMPDGVSLCLPSANVMSFLCATNTKSAAALVADPRKYKALAASVQAFVTITPVAIPLTREGKQIKFHGFINDVDEAGGIYVDRRVARLAKGVPNPKERPVIDLPWTVSFSLRLITTPQLPEGQLVTLFKRGGIEIGLGTYRGVFGKFLISQWE